MKKEITYKQLFLFHSAASAYLERTAEDNKLVNSIQSVLKQVRKDELIEEYNDLLNENNLSCCSVEEKTGAILKDEKRDYVFTVENMRRLIQLNKAVLKQTVSVNQLILPENNTLAKELTELEREAFAGVVIAEETH